MGGEFNFAGNILKSFDDCQFHLINFGIAFRALWDSDVWTENHKKLRRGGWFSWFPEKKLRLVFHRFFRQNHPVSHRNFMGPPSWTQTKVGRGSIFLSLRRATNLSGAKSMLVLERVFLWQNIIFKFLSQISGMQLVMNGVWFVHKTVAVIKRPAPCFTNTSTFPRSPRKFIYM